jgi:hypothetical protein
VRWAVVAVNGVRWAVAAANGGVWVAAAVNGLVQVAAAVNGLVQVAAAVNGLVQVAAVASVVAWAAAVVAVAAAVAAASNFLVDRADLEHGVPTRPESKGLGIALSLAPGSTALRRAEPQWRSRELGRGSGDSRRKRRPFPE